MKTKINYEMEIMSHDLP